MLTTDIAIYGGTPAGVTAAVRAAREGWRVVLINHTHHLGGMLANGLFQWDALSAHRRAPLFREVLGRIEAHYRETFGADSREHRNACFLPGRHPSGAVEPHVIERLFTQMVAAEPHISVLNGWCISRCRRRHRRVEALHLQQMDGDDTKVVQARVFIDASYEGDLAAQANVPYRVGREGHDETGEPHAGRIYTQTTAAAGLDPTVAEAWGVFPYPVGMAGFDPRSPRNADRAIQACNLRPCVTCNPANGVPLKVPPPAYDRHDYLTYRRRFMALHTPDRTLDGKSTFNAPIMPGANWDYPDGDWATRRTIAERHTRFALGLIWFLQNDPAIEAEQQEQFRQWQLCADEWPDNGHLPYEIYVREARRIVGRHMLSEHDLLPQPRTDAPRPFDDSIAFTDWYIDSHSCDRDGTTGEPASPDYPWNGKLIMGAEFRPAQIPYRSLLPRGVDNLLVPVCLGATHVAFNAVRLEPCWMHTGEVAGFAAAIALRDGTLPGNLPGEELAAELSARGVHVRYPTPRHPVPVPCPPQDQMTLSTATG